MLNNPNFLGVLIRHTFNTIKDSSYAEIVKSINEMGLSEVFTCTQSPLEIKCQNGAKLICRGMDEPNKLKSINAMFAWYEEFEMSKISEGDWLTVSSGLRSPYNKVQEVFTFNPECEGSYQDNWFYKRWFGLVPVQNSGAKSFKSFFEVQRGKRKIQLDFTVHHSTHLDNKYLTQEYRASLEDLKRTNPYYYKVYTLGLWGRRESGDLFYNSFDRTKHCNNLALYNSDRALHITLDFNSSPGNSCLVFQISGKTATCLESFFAKDDIGNSKHLCNLLKQKYNTHEAGMYIYGDASNKHEDTRSEAGWNDFKLIEKELKDKFHPTFLIPAKNPAVEIRGNFINEIFRHNLNGINIEISENANELIDDLENCKIDSDRTKLKSTFKKDGVTMERWGHMGDAMDYLLCKVFEKEFNAYKRGKIYDPDKINEAYFFGRDSMKY
jgi:PBSX family phage terminase large subunit